MCKPLFAAVVFVRILVLDAMFVSFDAIVARVEVKAVCVASAAQKVLVIVCGASGSLTESVSCWYTI